MFLEANIIFSVAMVFRVLDWNQALFLIHLDPNFINIYTISLLNNIEI